MYDYKNKNNLKLTLNCATFDADVWPHFAARVGTKSLRVLIYRAAAKVKFRHDTPTGGITIWN